MVEHEPLESDDGDNAFVVSRSRPDQLQRKKLTVSNVFLVHGAGLDQASLRDQSFGLALSDNTLRQACSWAQVDRPTCRSAGLDGTAILLCEGTGAFPIWGQPEDLLVYSRLAILMPLLVPTSQLKVVIRAG